MFQWTILLKLIGIGKLSSGDEKYLADSEILQRLTSSVSCALDEAAAALTRMRSDQPRVHSSDKRYILYIKSKIWIQIQRFGLIEPLFILFI